MKRIFLYCILLLLVGFKLSAQNISQDSKRISFVIASTTTSDQIKRADSLFTANGIDLKIKTNHHAGLISKVDISIHAAEGNAKYQTNNSEILEKGVLIVVDRSANASVALSVGPRKVEE
jgi:hypothetical protein